MTFEPRPRTETGTRRLARVGEERLLGRAAGVPERDPLRGVERVHPARQGRGDGVRQGEVHVVAAEQDVLADGLPGQGELAALLADGDQGEVGRPAADVADEQDVADLDLLPPAVALPGEPGIEGGLRLLEQRDLLQARRARGLDRQLAGDGVERGGDRQEDVLRFEPVGGGLARDLLVPGVAEVGQVGRRRLDRRDLGDVGRRRSRAGSRRGGRRPGARASSWPS